MILDFTITRISKQVWGHRSSGWRVIRHLSAPLRRTVRLMGRERQTNRDKKVSFFCTFIFGILTFMWHDSAEQEGTESRGTGLDWIWTQVGFRPSLFCPATEILAFCRWVASTAGWATVVLNKDASYHSTVHMQLWTNILAHTSNNYRYTTTTIIRCQKGDSKKKMYLTTNDTLIFTCDYITDS